MNRSEMVKLLGERKFMAAMPMMQKMKIEDAESIPGLAITKVVAEGSEYLVGSTSPKSSFCFTCGTKSCYHTAVAVLSRYLEDSEPEAPDDPELVNMQKIREEMEKMRPTTIYTAENFRRYGNNIDALINSDQRKVDALCKKINTTLSRADSRVRMFTEVWVDCVEHHQPNGYVVWPSDSFEESARRDLPSCGFETLSYVVDKAVWGKECIGNVNEEVLERLLEGRPITKYLSGAYLKLKRYDDYLEVTGRDPISMYPVVKELVESGDIEGARYFAGAMTEPEKDTYSATESRREIFKLLGDTEEVHRLDLMTFVRYTSQETLDQALESGDDSKSDIMGLLIEDLGPRPGMWTNMAMFMIKNGEIDYVCKILDMEDYRLKGGYGSWDKGSPKLFEELYDRGFKEEARDLARANLEAVLDARDNANYELSVRLLKLLDARFGKEPRYSKEHEEYKGALLEKYGRLRKFWDMYEGRYDPSKPKGGKAKNTRKR